MQPLRTPGHRGGALVEILLAVAVIGVLFTLIMSKVDIGDIFAKLASTGDEVGVLAIGRAMGDYRWDHGGDPPANANLTAELRFICKQTVSGGDCAAAGGAYLLDLVPAYLAEIPVQKDYTAGSELMTGYRIQYPVAGGRVRVTNPGGTEEFVY